MPVNYRTLDQLLDRLEHYGSADYVWFDWGHVAWHFSTGENVELLFIQVRDPGKGDGKRLIEAMCRRLIGKGREPFNSVFSFRRTDNQEAERFYASLGFEQRDLGEGIYKGIGATVAWIGWRALLERVGVPSWKGWGCRD